jgi:hypothetical protein
MIDAKGLSEKLPDLRVKLRRTLQDEGAADGLIRLMPLFFDFLEHRASCARRQVQKR